MAARRQQHQQQQPSFLDAEGGATTDYAAGHAREQIRRLEEQVAFFRQLAVQNNHVLADVRALLAEERGAEVAAISRRVTHLMERQSAAVRGGSDPAAAAASGGAKPLQQQPMVFGGGGGDSDADDDGAPTRRGPALASTQRPATSSASVAVPLFDGTEHVEARRGRSGGGGASAAAAADPATSEAIDDAARDVSERLLSAGARLSEAWLASKARAVDRALAAPLAAFEAFHEAPTEDALDGFLVAFREATAAVRSELDPAAPNASPSPFREDRVAELYHTAVRSALLGLRDDLQVAASVSPARQASLPARDNTMPPPHAIPAAAASARRVPAPLDAHAVGTRGGAAPMGQRGPLGAAGAPSTRDTRRPGEGIIGHFGGGGDSEAMARGRRPSTSGGSVASEPPHQTPARGGGAAGWATPGSATPSLSSQQTPRAMTPGRHSRVSQDSSQMKHSIFGDGSSNTGGVRRPGPGDPPESAEVAALRRQLAQLEMQMGLTAGRHGGGGGDTGSEAKFYALNKKIQRVRADLIARQREEQEVAAVRAAMEEQRAQRDHDRRVFGR